jgi:hypothetical protein
LLHAVDIALEWFDKGERVGRGDQPFALAKRHPHTAVVDKDGGLRPFTKLQAICRRELCDLQGRAKACREVKCCFVESPDLLRSKGVGV